MSTGKLTRSLHRAGMKLMAEMCTEEMQKRGITRFGRVEFSGGTHLKVLFWIAGKQQFVMCGGSPANSDDAVKQTMSKMRRKIREYECGK